jgi:signal peptidase I
MDPYRKISFKGYSMYPFLLPGDTLLFKTCGPDGFVPGDIIVYKDIISGRNVAHRIISKDPLKSKGDNLVHYDGVVFSEDNILGKAVYIQRGNRLLPAYSFLSGITAFLSMFNCTPGIIKSHLLGKPVKWVLGQIKRFKV